MMKKRPQFGIFTLLLIGLLVLSACDGGFRNYNDPSKERFFTGTDGVEIRLQPNAPPSKFFFYKNDPNRPNSDLDNSIPIMVELHNRGAAYSKGGVFISGFDPNLIEIDAVPMTRQPALMPCALGFQFYEGDFGGRVQCPPGTLFGANFGFDTNTNTWNFGADFGSLLTDYLGWPPGTHAPIQVVHDSAGKEFVSFGLNFGNVNDMSLGLYGRRYMLIASMASMFNFIESSYPWGKPFTLEGDSYEYPGGEIDFIQWDAKIVSNRWPDGLDQKEENFMVTSCYLYATYASPHVCIDPVPYSDSPKVCRPRDISYSGQGAPVAITRINQENTGREVIFTIDIQNKGKGTVFYGSPGYFDTCNPWDARRVTSREKNMVFIGDVRIIGDNIVNQLECKPSSRVIPLDERGTGRIICTYPLEYVQAKSAYQTPLVVELWYGYSESESRKVLIKRAR